MKLGPKPTMQETNQYQIVFKDKRKPLKIEAHRYEVVGKYPDVQFSFMRKFYLKGTKITIRFPFPEKREEFWGIEWKDVADMRSEFVHHIRMTRSGKDEL